MADPQSILQRPYEIKDIGSFPAPMPMRVIRTPLVVGVLIFRRPNVEVVIVVSTQVENLKKI